VHLNRICQNVVGKSALQVVQEYLIEESKKYLEYTSHSVSEIAYLLKFEYPNYFAKLFKKQTGISPTEYRELKRMV
jgi:AraC family transcriptional regulator, transcriptional activator of pobA